MHFMSQNREFIVTANWKMHKTVQEALLFVENLATTLSQSQEQNLSSLRICLAAPFTALYPLGALIQKKGYPFCLGAQNMHEALHGAFTGEVSAPLLKEAGASFVILGHSERRQFFGEGNVLINKKILQALSQKLNPTLCVGETLEEREKGETQVVLKKQLLECLEGVSEEELPQLQVAYEPVWAIGAGKGAEPSDVEEAHNFCRAILAQKWGKIVADKVVIQYGGSVQPENTYLLASQPNVDGLLIGGASLKVESFSEIISRACEALTRKI
jgi:triosephosphate isomerase